LTKTAKVKPCIMPPPVQQDCVFLSRLVIYQV